MASRIENDQLIVEWEPWDAGWKRTSWVLPGYDCRTECKHTPKGDHGICNDKWIYAVSDGTLALSFQVASRTYPPTVDSSRFANWAKAGHPEGRDFELHSPWPHGDVEDVTSALRAGGTSCLLLEGGACYMRCSTLAAGEAFWTKHGTPQFVQPESFWNALRNEAEAVWFVRARAEHEATKHLVRCPECAGVGVIDERNRPVIDGDLDVASAARGLLKARKFFEEVLAENPGYPAALSEPEAARLRLAIRMFLKASTPVAKEAINAASGKDPR